MKSLFSRIFGREDEHPAKSPVADLSFEIDEYSHGLVSIDALDFIGHMSSAPGGRFKLIWADRHPASGTGGSREAGHGYWALLGPTGIIVDGQLERPQEGKVSDTGTVILNDWLFGNELQSRFTAFRPDGTPIISHYLTANVMNNAISEDGRFAICQTANAPGSPDSCRYILFDLEQAREMSRWETETGWTAGYIFDTANRRVRLFHKDDEVVDYDFDGTMVDREAWEDRRIARGDIEVIRSILERSPQGVAEPQRAKLLSGLDHAANAGEAWQKATAFRLSGELHERTGDERSALAAYDKALLLDPQVGVSRRADKLRKKLEPAASTAKRMGKFERQADRLGIAHEVIELEAGGAKAWRLDTGAPFGSIEAAALEFYRARGWAGAAAEGGLMLTLIKAASFTSLQQRHADTFIEALYAQNVAFAEDRFEIDDLVASCARADEKQVERNWRILSATAGMSPAYYPDVRWEHVRGLFAALGNARLAEIARAFAAAPYDLRAGWPDLTLWKGDQIRFAEVKGPGDSMHASQARLISSLLKPLGHDVVLAEIRAR
jgi:hypothetical protein